MTGKDSLSFDEFLTAPRKRSPVDAPEPMGGLEPLGEKPGKGAAAAGASPTSSGGDLADDDTRRQDARKALRQMKRERTKGASHFVNVNLDRETKRRLKFAAFNTDTSMQMIMERAIRSYLDDHGL
jgi:hypothetical protein